jgi:hypothetical protein
MQSTPLIKDTLIDKLSLGPLYAPSLVQAVAIDSKATIQGVYKALRQLKKEEVVVSHHKTIALSTVWLAAEVERLERIQKTYSLREHFFNVKNTNRDQTVSFRFKTINELDLFWTHAFLSLEEHCAQADISIAIAPHDWFIYARKQTDQAWVKKHSSKQRKLWVIVTHADVLDKKVIRARKKDPDTEIEALFENPLHQNELTYYSSIGPYIIKVILDKSVGKALNIFVATHTTFPLTEQDEYEIADIMKTKGTFRISITKSERKALLIKKKLGKYFL